MTTTKKNSLAGAPTQVNTKQGSADEMELDGVPEAEEKEHLASVCRLESSCSAYVILANDSCCIGRCARVGTCGRFRLEHSSKHSSCGGGRTEEVLDMDVHGDLRAHSGAGMHWRRGALLSAT